MTDQDRQEIIDLIRSQSQPVEALEAEAAVDAISSIIATRGDTLIRAPIALLQRALAYTPYDADTASRALSGATLTFSGFVTSPSVTTVPTTSPQAIFFDLQRSIFVAQTPEFTYTTQWTLQPDYMDNTTTPPRPHASRIYLDVTTSRAYTYSPSQASLIPLGTSLSALTFNFQAIDTFWHVQHNLGRYPQVTVQDAEGNEVECDVRHLSPQELTIRFATPISGSVTLT